MTLPRSSLETRPALASFLNPASQMSELTHLLCNGQLLVCGDDQDTDLGRLQSTAPNINQCSKVVYGKS